jgi:ADP-dependent NAD(P)H-hydrate dehydratase / NAD(P)H-hydrate epimerase
MKILTADQIRELDRYTIEHEPVTSLNLMERAATACFRRLLKLINVDVPVYVFCGKGNNGGDGLAISRLLSENGRNCTTFVIEHAEHFSPDAQANYDKLLAKHPKRVISISATKDLLASEILKGAVAIDAIFGTGLKRAPEGLAADVIPFINQQFKRVISIDLPSGLYADAESAHKAIVRSSLTLTFQLPKLAFLVPDNSEYVPEFELVDINLSREGLEKQGSDNFYLVSAFIASLLRKRNKFSHKGDYGHAILFAGSSGMSGAALISAKACLRSGAGLLTVHSTKTTLTALLSSLPEAMAMEDENPTHISGVDKIDRFDAVGFGPGAGRHEDTATALKKILQYYSGPLVIDADGLNILSENKTWLNFLPADTILTPHPGEFDRLTQKHQSGWDRLHTLRDFARKHNCIVALKGAHTAIAMPDGNIVFNSTGNAGLAKGGSGDALTGIILGLLARGYPPPQAAIIGVFVHGMAADLVAKKKSMESLLASDIIEALPKAFRKLEEMKQ